MVNSVNEELLKVDSKPVSKAPSLRLEIIGESQAGENDGDEE
jgi:hypothetical protein